MTHDNSGPDSTNPSKSEAVSAEVEAAHTQSAETQANDSGHAPESETQPESVTAESQLAADPGESPSASPTSQEGSASPQDLSSEAGERKAKLQIGSRKGDDAPRGAKPHIAGVDKPVVLPPAPSGPVKPPSIRDPLSPELERELEEALGDRSIDNILNDEAGAVEIPLETRIRSSVMRIEGDNVFFLLGGRNEGVVSLRQFKEPPQVGEPMDVIAKRVNREDGLYELTVPGAAVDVSDWADIDEGTIVEARVTGANTGGLECKVNNIRGFIPASQVALYRVENLSDFIDQKFECVVTEANPSRKNLVLSRRAYLERQREDERKETFAKLEVGQVVDGTVRNIRDFGAFVDIGGLDGLVHISQLSWERVNHPSEVLEEGQKVRVRIEKIDNDSGKIGLSIRSLEEHPWSNVEQRFPIGSTVNGTVSRIAKFGAFVKLAPGVEGLIHISELAHQRIGRVADVVKEGQDVQAKLLSIDAENQRIALSLKALLEAPAAAEEQEAEDEPPREPAVPRRNEPLKGGTNRNSGGEQFGLKW